MLFLTAPGGRFRVVVFVSADLDRLTSGAPIMPPDRSMLLAWTPDQPWLEERLRTGAGTPHDIAKAIDEANARPQIGTLLGADGQPLPASANGTPKKPEASELEQFFRVVASSANELDTQAEELRRDNLSPTHARAIAAGVETIARLLRNCLTVVKGA